MAKVSFWDFVRDQWSTAPPVTTADLTGKTVVVVGANTGLGFEATKHFASMDPGRLILGCRSAAKGDAAVAKIEQETGYSKAEVWLIDLARFASVREFASTFEKEGERLDYLIMNAGKGTSTYEATEDGWESSLQVNDLSTSLLVLLLLPQLIRTAREHAATPRVVIVASGVHMWTSIPQTVTDTSSVLATLGSKEFCTPAAMGVRYFVTKLLNVFFTRALNKHLGSLPVTVDALDPGYCYSEFRRELSGIRWVLDGLMERALAFPTEIGGRRIVYAALAGTEREEEFRGAYVNNFRVAEPSDFVLENGELQERLWKEVLDILGKVDPRVGAVVNEYLSQA